MRPVLLALLLLAAPAALAGQETSHVLSGRVLTAADGQPIGGAQATLGTRSVGTSEDGTFRFADVPAGAVRLVVSALGYADAAVELVVARDTSLIIRLTEQAIALDPLEVEARRITVSGRVIDPVHRLGVRARVLVRPGDRHDDTNHTGRFRISRVPVVDSSAAIAEGFGYLPQRVWLTTGRDTSVTFVMERDPVVDAVIARQLERIAERSSQLGPLEVEVISGDSMNFAGTLQEILRYQFDLMGARCMVVDERVMSDPNVMVNRWELQWAENIHTIEVIELVIVSCAAIIRKFI